MSTTVIGILLLITYIGMIVYLVKGGNATITMLVMGIIWYLLSGDNFTELIDHVITGTISKYALNVVTIMFGAWFAQIIIQRKIATSIIRSAVELGGDRPAVVSVIMVWVIGFLFLSLYSVGPTIAVGVVALPIMLSMGIAPAIASTVMALGVGVAYLVNFSQYTAIRGLFPEGMIPEQITAPFVPYAYIVVVAGLIITSIGVVIALKRSQKTHSWCAAAEIEDEERVKWYAYLTPLVPVVMVLAFEWDIFPSFLLGIAYAMITTWKKGTKGFNVVIKAFSDGMADSGAMIIYLLCTYVFSGAATEVVPIVQEILGWALPTTTLQMAILFAVICPLVIYRGPAAVFGAGIAIYTSLLAAGQIPATFVVLIALTISSVHSSIDPTQSVVVWINSYTKVKSKDFLKVALPIGWIYGVVGVVICYLMHG